VIADKLVSNVRLLPPVPDDPRSQRPAASARYCFCAAHSGLAP